MNCWGWGEQERKMYKQMSRAANDLEVGQDNTTLSLSGLWDPRAAHGHQAMEKPGDMVRPASQHVLSCVTESNFV